jgi:protein disulfide isomerase
MGDSMAKFKPETDDLSTDSFNAFIKGVESGTITKHLMSEEIPEDNSGPVFTIVGKNYEATVYDAEKDVLVEFYAPWCGHCKKLEPIYREIAKRLEGVRTMVVAKIDMTANDVEGVDVEGFPTIKFWRADKKDDPLDYDGDRDVDSFITWLEEKAALPFNRDELKTEL